MLKEYIRNCLQVLSELSPEISWGDTFCLTELLIEIGDTGKTALHCYIMHSVFCFSKKITCFIGSDPIQVFNKPCSTVLLEIPAECKWTHPGNFRSLLKRYRFEIILPYISINVRHSLISPFIKCEFVIF